MRRKVLALVVLFSLLASVAGAVCYIGRIHEHSGFSDGGFVSSVVILKSKVDGISFLGQTDHYAAVVSGGSEKIAKYRKAFSSKANMAVISGAEITTSFGPGGQSHTLALGDVWDDPVIRSIAGKRKQQELITQLNQLNVLSVAAHPSIRQASIGDHRLSLDYSFDKEHAEGINGIEFFNDGPYGEETLQWYLSLLRRGKRVFVTGGCDDHIGQTDKLAKKTGVFSNQKLTVGSLLAAIRAGKTLALQNNVMLEYISVEPGFVPTVVNRPFLKIKVRSGRNLSGTKVRVFRDGVYEPADSATMKSVPGEKGRYLYSWTDDKVGKGEHNYVIFVGDLLITSPICLMVTGEKPTAGSYDDSRPQAITRQGILKDAFMGAGEAIGFISNRDGGNALYTFDTKTKELAKFADLTGFRDSFTFSRGGNRVLLVRSDDTIVVLTIEAKTMKVSTNDLKIKSSESLFPTWVSNKSFLFENSQGQIMQAELAEEQPVDLAKQAGRLDAGLGKLFRAAQSAGLIKDQKPRLVAKVGKPDARSFLIVRHDTAGLSQLCIINEFGKVFWLTHGKSSSTLPTMGQMGLISPIGLTGPIAFCSNRSGNWDIYQARLAEGGLGNLVRLTTSKANEVQPAWAFNSGKIYYTSDAGGHQRIYVMDADGRNQQIVMR